MYFQAVAFLLGVHVAVSQIQVTTDSTTYVGVQSPLFPDEVERFLGVQYADAPVGDLRY